MLYHSPRALRDKRVLILVAGLGICVITLGFFIHHIRRDDSTSFFKSDSYASIINNTHSIVEIEGLHLGRVFASSQHATSYAKLLEDVNAEFLSRLNDLQIDTDHPQCSADLSRYGPSGLLRTRRSDSSARISIAIDLYNAQLSLPSLSLALIELVHTLRPTHQIYLSIFENDSTDLTRPALGELGAALIALGIDGLWLRSSLLSRPKSPEEGGSENPNGPPPVERITALAFLRDEALRPLLPHASNGIVMFINDVITCSRDLLELLHQHRLQKAHVVASTDWDKGGDPDQPEDGSPMRFNPWFRDVWVARGINGRLPFPTHSKSGWPWVRSEDNVKDLWSTQEDSIHQRWLAGRPFPVYSSWNGAVAISASLFTECHLRFRGSGRSGWNGGDSGGYMGEWGRLLATPGYLDSDCAASECKLFARDTWNLLGGKARILVAPQSRTTYFMDAWRAIDNIVPPTRRTGAGDWRGDLINWNDVTVPSEVVCIPSVNDDGKEIFPWDPDNERHRTTPMFAGYKPGEPPT